MNREEFEKKLPHNRFYDFAPHPNGCGLVENTAKAHYTAYVGPDALVCDKSKIYGNAQIFGNAMICDNAKVSGNARVFSNAIICGNSIVCENATVDDEAQICDGWVGGYAAFCSGKLNRTAFWFYCGKHVLTLQGDGSITIGCIHMTIDNWLKNYEGIGKKNNYSNYQIEMYGEVLKKIKAGIIKY